MSTEQSIVQIRAIEYPVGAVLANVQGYHFSSAAILGGYSQPKVFLDFEEADLGMAYFPEGEQDLTIKKVFDPEEISIRDVFPTAVYLGDTVLVLQKPVYKFEILGIIGFSPFDNYVSGLDYEIQQIGPDIVLQTILEIDGSFLRDSKRLLDNQRLELRKAQARRTPISNRINYDTYPVVVCFPAIWTWEASFDNYTHESDSTYYHQCILEAGDILQILERKRQDDQANKAST
jgi:hypothetical protein